VNENLSINKLEESGSLSPGRKSFKKKPLRKNTREDSMF